MRVSENFLSQDMAGCPPPEATGGNVDLSPPIILTVDAIGF